MDELSKLKSHSDALTTLSLMWNYSLIRLGENLFNLIIQVDALVTAGRMLIAILIKEFQHSAACQ